MNTADKVMIFGGDGCRSAAAEVVTLAQQLLAPVGFTYKGKAWLEADNPNAVGMTGLLGYGGCYHAIKHADVILMLGTDFPFPDFLRAGDAKIVQVDTRAGHLGRRVALTRGIVSDVGAFVRDLAPLVAQKTDSGYLDDALQISQR